MPPPAMTMSAVSWVLELIMWEVTTDILGRGVASPRRARPHRPLIITEVRITAVERRLNLLSFLQ